MRVTSLLAALLLVACCSRARAVVESCSAGAQAKLSGHQRDILLTLLLRPARFRARRCRRGGVRAAAGAGPGVCPTGCCICMRLTRRQGLRQRRPAPAHVLQPCSQARSGAGCKVDGVHVSCACELQMGAGLSRARRRMLACASGRTLSATCAAVWRRVVARSAARGYTGRGDSAARHAGHGGVRRCPGPWLALRHRSGRGQVRRRPGHCDCHIRRQGFPPRPAGTAQVPGVSPLSPRLPPPAPLTAPACRSRL